MRRIATEIVEGISDLPRGAQYLGPSFVNGGVPGADPFAVVIDESMQNLDFPRQEFHVSHNSPTWLEHRFIENLIFPGKILQDILTGDNESL